MQISPNETRREHMRTSIIEYECINNTRRNHWHYADDERRDSLVGATLAGPVLLRVAGAGARGRLALRCGGRLLEEEVVARRLLLGVLLRVELVDARPQVVRVAPERDAQLREEPVQAAQQRLGTTRHKCRSYYFSTCDALTHVLVLNASDYRMYTFTSTSTRRLRVP